MGRLYNSKQQIRKELERRTDPDSPQMEQIILAMASELIAGHISIRNGIRGILSMTADNEDFPSQLHKDIVDRITSGMKERMVAFELELLGVIVDIIWEIDNCQCDWCAAREAEIKAADRASKAKYN
jgi:hypothetical protein